MYEFEFVKCEKCTKTINGWRLFYEEKINIENIGMYNACNFSNGMW